MHTQFDFSTNLNPPRIEGINKIGLYTLTAREVGRFLNVYSQTIIAPVVTTLLYYAVFALAFGGLQREIGGMAYLDFLAPGLIMMTMVQNAFANTSSSMVISKYQGTITDLLMPPLSPMELFLGFVIGGVARGLVVGLATGLVIYLFVDLHIHSFVQILAFGVLGTMLLSTIGLAGGIWSDKFDHIAAVTNFLVTPLTFLSGTFYSIHQLPGIWQDLAVFNPFFYMIDGFRAGFIGHADGNVWIGLITLTAVNVLAAILTLVMLRTGYKIKS